MEAFTHHTGFVAPLDRTNVDTDQIVPKRYLTGVHRTGYEDALFHDWRLGPDGTRDPVFVLNREVYRGASILVAGANFGCGSSREHAVWALRDAGFRAVIAPSFADIFAQNSLNEGLLVIRLTPEETTSLMEAATTSAPYRLTIDLETQRLAGGDGFAACFAVDPFRREALLGGWDEIDMVLRSAQNIAVYEARLPPHRLLAEPS